jgi:hypothetical protein
MKHSRKSSLVVVVSMLALLLVPLSLSAAANATLNPSADLWTDANAADTVKSNAGVLRTAYSNVPSFSASEKAYLRFSLSDWTTDVGSGTKLRLYVTTGALNTTGTLVLWSTDDDWNGITAGLGDETTLTWNNAPAQITQLDSKPNLAMGNWIEFSGSQLSGYLNGKRAAHGGNDTASFVVFWQGCTACDTIGDRIKFENDEMSGGTVNRPEIVPDPPTAVTMSTFQAADPAVIWPLIAGLGALVALTAGGVLFYRKLATTH